MNYELEEFKQLDSTLLLIASENYPSEDILEASGSIFQLPYSEGFPGKRYYQGTKHVDEMEAECIEKCLELYHAKDNYNANVQPNSGASANMIVYNAILEPGDTVLAMDVKAGGHISHSHPKSFLSKYHNVITYSVTDNGYLDYDEIEKLALEHKPKLIVCGASNYSREISFSRFKAIADKVNALLMADIAHISALVAHNKHESPINYADFITSTTHKMLRGPRGAFIIYKKEFDKKIRLSTIPGLFGGPLEHQIYAKLKCFNEMLSNDAKAYVNAMGNNAKAMERAFNDLNIPMVTGGTDNHLVTVDLTNYDISGKQLASILEECGVVCNCNTVPNDPRSFLETSGIRLGIPAITARGLDESDCYTLFFAIGNLINCFKGSDHNLEYTKQLLKNTCFILTQLYPLRNIYPKMYQKLFK